MTDAMALLEAVDQVAQEREANAAPLPDARRRPADPGRAPVAAARRRPSSGSCWPSRGWPRCSTQCARCGRRRPRSSWSPSTSVEGGVLCREHRRRAGPRARRRSALIRRILGGGLGRGPPRAGEPVDRGGGGAGHPRRSRSTSSAGCDGACDGLRPTGC